jgi:hypothetical protein
MRTSGAQIECSQSVMRSAIRRYCGSGVSGWRISELISAQYPRQAVMAQSSPWSSCLLDQRIPSRGEVHLLKIEFDQHVVLHQFERSCLEFVGHRT